MTEPFGNVTLFVDNLYCTYQMCVYLRSKNIYCVNTVRFNNLPPDLKLKFKSFKNERCLEETSIYNEVPIIKLHTAAHYVGDV